MNILSIDIGIKNLAFCLLQYNETREKLEKIKILDWDVLNLSNDINQKCIYYCSKKNKQCNFNACFVKEIQNNDTLYYCKKHCNKNYNYKTPTKNIIQFIKKQKNINKNKLIELYEEIFKHKIKDTKLLKEKIIQLLNNKINNEYFMPIIKQNASKLSLIDIGIKMNIDMENKYNFWIKNFKKIDIILIENQIGIKAIRMKTIQGMISMFFIMKKINNIEYISSINKLKILNLKNNKLNNDNNIIIQKVDNSKNYKERKKSGIEIVKSLLNIIDFSLLKKDKEMNLDIINLFNKHKKQDDLTDTLLQGIWYLNENIDKEIYNNISNKLSY